MANPFDEARRNAADSDNAEREARALTVAKVGELVAGLKAHEAELNKYGIRLKTEPSGISFTLEIGGVLSKQRNSVGWSGGLYRAHGGYVHPPVSRSGTPLSFGYDLHRSDLGKTVEEAVAAIATAAVRRALPASWGYGDK